MTDFSDWKTDNWLFILSFTFIGLVSFASQFRQSVLKLTRKTDWKLLMN